MAERTPFEDAVRTAFDANLRYWETVGRATADYVQSVTKLLADAPLSWTPGIRTPAALQPATTLTQPARSAPALILEGGAGTEARAVVMLSNDLARKADAEVVASALVGPDGRALRLKLRTQPQRVSLAAGARAPVTILVNITEALEPGIDYHGEVSVPGLAERGVSVIVRRLPGD